MHEGLLILSLVVLQHLANSDPVLLWDTFKCKMLGAVQEIIGEHPQEQVRISTFLDCTIAWRQTLVIHFVWQGILTSFPGVQEPSPLCNIPLTIERCDLPSLAGEKGNDLIAAITRRYTA